MKKAIKQTFDANIDLKELPGYGARFNTAGNVGPQINLELQPTKYYCADGEKDLRKKLQSGTDPRSLPSIILRRNGKKVG